MTVSPQIVRVTVRDLASGLLVGKPTDEDTVRTAMKKLVLTLASLTLALGAPTMAYASAPSCGYDHACEDGGHHDSDGRHGHRHLGGGGAHATGAAVGSPGVLSGNVVQVPIHIPINVCGNTVNVIGLLNPAFGNTCINA